MARTPNKPEKHTIESLAEVADQLEKLAARLKTAVSGLQVDPPINSLMVRYETSLVDGLQFLRNWTTEVVDRANDARLASMKTAKNGSSVRKTGHVSDGSKKGIKISAQTKLDGEDSHG